MQIQSLIRPTQLRPGQTTLARTVEVYGQKYVFTKTVDDKFVAEVADPKAIECLLKLPKLYREYISPAPALARQVTIDPADKAAVAAAEQAAKAAEKAAKEREAAEREAAAKADAAVADQEAREKANEAAAAVDAEVLALLSSTPQAIKKLVEKKTPSREVLEKALANEKGSEKPRQQVVNLLSGTLASLEDA